MKNALLRSGAAVMLSFLSPVEAIAEPDLVWRRTIEGVGTWQAGLVEPKFWCRDDARMGLADLREEAARDCTARAGRRVVTTPVEEEIDEGDACRARQDVICAHATPF